MLSNYTHSGLGKGCVTEDVETIVDSLVRKLRRVSLICSLSSSFQNRKIGEGTREVFLILVRKI